MCNAPQRLGSDAETSVAQLLRAHGRTVISQGYYDPFDLLVDGRRIEVKSATPRTDGGNLFWLFNLHRHGVIAEDYDAYVFRLEAVPYSKYAVHLFAPAPIGRMSFAVSFRSLLNGDAMMALDFQKFARGEMCAKLEAVSA